MKTMIPKPERPTPREIAEDFAIPQFGYVPPLPRQFPDNTPDEFRDALKLITEDYREVRDEWEREHNMFYYEFRFGRRMHGLDQRPEVMMMRAVLVGPEKLPMAWPTECELSTFINDMSREQLEEVGDTCCERWILESLVARCQKHDIPVVVSEGQSDLSLRVPPTDPFDSLPPSLRELAQEGRIRYEREASIWLKDEGFSQEFATLDYSYERLSSFKYQIGRLGYRE